MLSVRIKINIHRGMITNKKKKKQKINKSKINFVMKNHHHRYDPDESH